MRGDFYKKAIPLIVDKDENIIDSGMDLRDYFAAKAMQSLILKCMPTDTIKQASIEAYEIADAMMKQREL